MEKVRAFYKKYLKNSFFFCLVWAFILNLIIETLARKGFGGFLFLFDSPLVFFYNTWSLLRCSGEEFFCDSGYDYMDGHRYNEWNHSD